MRLIPNCEGIAVEDLKNRDGVGRRPQFVSIFYIVFPTYTHIIGSNFYSQPWASMNSFLSCRSLKAEFIYSPSCKHVVLCSPLE